MSFDRSGWLQRAFSQAVHASSTGPLPAAPPFPVVPGPLHSLGHRRFLSGFASRRFPPRPVSFRRCRRRRPTFLRGLPRTTPLCRRRDRRQRDRRRCSTKRLVPGLLRSTAACCPCCCTPRDKPQLHRNQSQNGAVLSTTDKRPWDGSVPQLTSGVRHRFPTFVADFRTKRRTDPSRVFSQLSHAEPPFFPIRAAFDATHEIWRILRDGGGVRGCRVHGRAPRERQF